METHLNVRAPVDPLTNFFIVDELASVGGGNSFLHRFNELLFLVSIPLNGLIDQHVDRSPCVLGQCFQTRFELNRDVHTLSLGTRAINVNEHYAGTALTVLRSMRRS